MARRSIGTSLLAALALATAAGCASKDSGGCESGQVLCGGCYDPARYQTDAGNCGGCGIQCGAGATCAGGSCVCGPGTSLCGNLSPRCRDLTNDASACGTCDTSCTTQEVGWTCLAGQCGCFPDRTECGTICTNTSIDPRNCGDGTAGCANACKPGEVCGSTPPQCQCLPPLTPCATACTNTQTDVTNCGTCGNVCVADAEVCSSGLCRCPVFQPDRCPGQQGAAAACVNKANDERNCGACGNACPAGGTCTGGSCQCPAGAIVCANVCVPCAGGTCNGAACECPAGPPSGCNGRCCAGGNACCGNGNCQTQHNNGLGQLYFDCNFLYSPQNPTTEQAATAAANAWSAIGTNRGICDPFCIGRQTGSQCAVWCYGGSNVAGRVSLNTLSNVCVCPNPGSPTWN